MLMPEPDRRLSIVATRICTGLRKILPAGSLVDSLREHEGLRLLTVCPPTGNCLWLSRFRKRSIRSRQ